MRRRHGRGVLADLRGAVAVESALTFSLLLLPLFLGGADVAMLMGTQLRLQAAVRNAVFYAYASSSNATDATAIENAATAGYGSGGPTLTVATPSYAYYCIAPTGTEATGTAESSSSANCPSGQSLATWLTVSVSATVALPFTVAPFAASMPLSAGATVRVN
jgi:Flp pilus assembly protein TadG